MAVPLHTRLMAESFNSHLKVYKETGSPNLPEKLNVIELFHCFVKTKFSILFEEKRQIDTTKPSNKREFKRQYKEFEEEHMTYSLIVIFTESECRLLKPDNIVTQARSNCIKIEEGFEQTGIIDMIKNGIPHFIHRSFAEYFCALWLRKNCDENKNFLKKKLHRQELKIMWKMLNYIVSEGHNLHIAVLNNDMQKMKTLLDDGIEVDQTDAWGRSALHLAAACNYRNIIELLLRYGADMKLRDSLGFDPLDYCERTTSWASVDFMLSASKGRRDDQLPFLKENINNAAFGIQALRESTEYGHIYLAEFLLKNGLDLETILNEENQQILHIASRNNQVEIINLVLESSTVITKHKYTRRNEEQIDSSFKHKIVNTKDKSGWTPLLYASRQGNLDIVQILIKHKADVSFRNESGECALHLAVREGHLSVVKYLVEHGADIQLGNNKEYTPLFIAVAAGHLSVVDFLVQNGARINVGNYCGETPIYVAAHDGNLPSVEYLAKNGADINKCTTYDHTPLHMAAWFGHPSVVEFLVQKGANVQTENKGGQTALCYATTEGLLTIVDYLIQHGANIHFHDRYGQTSLHKAAYYGHLSVTKCLIQHDANVNAVNILGQTPLHLAAQQGHFDIVEYLLTQNGQVEISDNCGCTALHLAAYGGHLSVVECLAQNEALINLGEDLGYSPLHFAAEEGHVNIVECLLRNKADVNLRNNDGITALHLAAEEGHVFVVKCLLDNGALVNISDKRGNIPLRIAVEERHWSVVSCLLRRGSYFRIGTIHISLRLRRRSC
ncbi:ankyrin-1-like [Periplaneta americana]|uniref:ankyrin-1-like n=1 Tax=Periplaneta americana TaxID=6978 RepID=UPI0037E863D6